MRGLFWIVLSFVAACSGVANKAFAENAQTIFWKQVGDWRLLVDKTVGHGCFMIGAYQQGTMFRVGINPQAKNGYAFIGDDNWRSLELGKDYNLIFRFDTETPWNVPARARTIGSGTHVFLYAQFSDPRFLVELARKQALTISYRDRVVTSLALTGSHAAVRELYACQQTVDSALGPRTTDGQRTTDPFAPAGGQRASDPFR